MIFLGDLVGYGPNPNEVVELYSDLKNVSGIRGNHDKVVAELESAALFNPVASESARWAQKSITPENKEFIKKLPQGPLVLDNFITICHGSPFDEDYYIFSKFEAMEAIRFIKTSIGFFGHTHFPVLYMYRNSRLDIVEMKENRRIKLDMNTKYLINPGSIGQPRDRCNRSSFITFDSDKMIITFNRLKYDYQTTQQKIYDANLPDILGERLETGV
jgi:predicted phosphodiesterase